MTGKNEAQRLESQLAHARIKELRESPVEGTFDAAHLREINRRIFQDLPEMGFTGVRPGAFREPNTSPTRDWIKHRDMEGLPPSTVAYSRMDADAMSRMDAALERANPEALARLDTAAFTKEIAAIYTELDYVHPFDDGNSRTLREFTKQLANEAGHDIDWSRFDVSEAGRNVLYVARDLSVNAIALPLAKGEDTRRELTFMLDQFGGNRDLSELLPDAVTRHDRTAGLERDRFNAAEDALASTISQHYMAADGAPRDAAIRTIAETLHDLDRDLGHSDAEPTEERPAQRRERDHGDDYGL